MDNKANKNAIKQDTFKTSKMLAVLLATITLSSCQGNGPLGVASRIPIQHEGRIKSIDVFARETVQLVSGKTRWEKKEALHFILNHLSAPREFLSIKWIRIDFLELKKALSLDPQRKYFAYQELKPSFPALYALVQGSQAKRDSDQAPSKLEQKAEQLYIKIDTVDKLVHGETLLVIPRGAQQAWLSPFTSSGARADQFRQIVSLYSEDSYQKFRVEAEKWIETVNQQISPSIVRKISLENIYYQIKPFHSSWILYLLSFILLMTGRNHLWRSIGSLALGAGFLFHTGGLALIICILSRPPVSNMYESMIFMNWVLMLCAFIYYFIGRRDFILKAGALASAFVMIYGDLLPIDQTLDVLVPVLRSNYWLTIHVLTIVSSYGIFGLAMALGHRHLFCTVTGKFSRADEQASAHIIYRLIQAGVIALGIGTVLGGVWANESWGRFWGWDPKETWALITFLGYLVVVHLRSGGKMNDFWLGVSSILGFLLVLMTWYGVNFLLGRGLHSYGTGSGGVEWILYYLIFEVLFLSFVIFQRLKTVP